MLAVISATPEGKKELVGFQGGSGKARGASINCWPISGPMTCASPEPAVADGALALWMALDAISFGARYQHCRFHKTDNVVNTFFKAMRAGSRLVTYTKVLYRPPRP